MTQQSSGGGSGLPVGGILSGNLPNPAFATNGTTPILGTVQAHLAANVNMTNASQSYDGPSLVLTAGSWLVTATVTLFNAGGNTDLTCQLWDGVTTLISCETNVPNTISPVTVTLSYPVTVAVPTTYKFSAVATGAGTVIQAAAVHNGVGNNASSISALRIA